MSSSKASIRKGRSKQGRSADAVELNGSSDVDDDRPFQRRRPRPLPLSSLHLVLSSLLARLAHFVFAKLLPASFLPTWRRYRKWRSTRLRGRAFGAALPPDKETNDDGDKQQSQRRKKEKRKPLPTDAGLAALRLANCRDLASACDPLLIAPGRLFRSASPFAVAAAAAAAGGGGGGGGGEAEAAAAAARALSGASASASGAASSARSSASPRGLNLALVIDLRSANEWEAGRGDEVLQALASLCDEKESKSGNESAKSSSSSSDAPPPPPPSLPLAPLRVERVALQEWKRYTYAFVARLPATRSLGAAAHFLLFKALGCRAPIPGMHSRLCADTERGGLVAMNTTVLAAFPLEIARVLRLVSGTVSSSSASPPPSVMVACKLGKDRTGLVSALCLAVAGASRREVVADYARSAAELAGRPPPATAPSLGGAPGAAMERTLDWLSEHFAGFADEREAGRYREREAGRCREREAGRCRESEAGRRRRRGGVGGGGGESENGSDFSSRSPRRCWRAGVLGYLEREARFLADEREALRRALTE